MGVQFSEFVQPKQIEFTDLAGKKIAIDAFNTIFQFLSIIRDRFTGEPLKDSKGRVTSHLSGILYRFSTMLEAGIKPIMVFDGEPPEFKRRTIEEREAAKQEAEKKWKEAVKKGKEAMRYAQAASRLTDEMIGDAKKLLDYMGIPWYQAPGEGEAACSVMCKKGDVDYVGSQDYDSLLFGAPRFVKNLSVSGRRKVPNKEVYVEVKPEVIELDDVLKTLGVTHEQLVIIGLLIGTDYNNGVKGVGPKTALKIVKENKTLEKILEKVQWTDDIEPQELVDFFLKQKLDDKPRFVWKEPDTKKILKFMVDEHNFSAERIQKVVDRIQTSYSKVAQSSLGSWLKK